MLWTTLMVALAAPGDFVEPEVELLWDARRPGGGQFGWAVSALEDIDGDGAMEVITSDPFVNNNAGEVVVLSGRTGEVLYTFAGAPGSKEGFAIADAGDVDGDGLHDVIGGAASAGTATVWSGADGSVLHTLATSEPGDYFGCAVSSAGDVDGDGRADLLVGAELSDGVAVDAGRVDVLSGATGAVLYSLWGTNAGDHFGSGVGLVGDVSGDGVPDAVIGARDAGATGAGQLVVGSGRDGSVIHTLEDGTVAGSLGYFFVGGVGDMDGDGVADVYGGDFSNSASGPGTGRGTVWSGATGARIHQLTGTAVGEGLGTGRGAGDVDGDGVPDLSLGSWTSSAGGAQAGQITVFSGSDGSVIRTVTSLSDGENFGFDVVGMGDVDGDGDIELVASAATKNRVYLIAGLGGTVPPVDSEPEGTPDDSEGGCGCASGGAGPVGALWCLGLVGLVRWKT